MIGEACCSVAILSPPRPAFDEFRLPAEVIMAAVCCYLRYGRSYRDVEQLPAEHGFEEDHATVYRWVAAVHAEAG